MVQVLSADFIKRELYADAYMQHAYLSRILTPMPDI